MEDRYAEKEFQQFKLTEACEAELEVLQRAN